MGLNMITKIGYGHLCLRKENLSFNNKYIIQELKLQLHRYLINQDNAEIMTSINIYKVQWRIQEGGGLLGLQPPRRISQAHILTYAFQG